MKMTGWIPGRTFRQRGSAAVVAAVVVLSLLTGSAVGAQTTRSGQGAATASNSSNAMDDRNALLAQLRSPEVAQRKQAAKQFQQMQRTLGQQILESAKKQVEEVQESDKKFRPSAAKLTPAQYEKQFSILLQKAAVTSEIILLLGELHVEEAIPFLLKNIQFVDFGQRNNHWNWSYRYPCLGALIALGPPAADATLHGIEENSILGRQSLWGEEVLARMLGPRGAVGFLQDRIDTLKKQQKAPAPEKPPAVPISVRIERLETVRSHIEARAEEWVSVNAILKPNTP